jgi:hypothetical protein
MRMTPGAPSPIPGITDLPVDAATLYPEPDGFLGRRARARRAKLLAGIADVLRRALAPGELVRYAARGVRYSPWEHVFGGAAVAQYHNMTALVLTDRRLLLVQVGSRGRAADIKNQVALDAIRGAKRGFLSGWTLRLADGTKLSFTSLRGPDRKRLEALLPAAAPAAPASREPSLVALCPACLRPVPGPVGATLTCPQQDCRIPFRDPRKAARLSAVVPGLGDLYLRHHFFGAVEFLGSMAMLGVAAALVAQTAVAGEPGGAAAVAVAAFALVLLPRAIDYRLTLHMGRKGLVPLALAPAPGAQARNLPSYPRWSALLFAAGVAVTGTIVAAMSADLREQAVAREASRLAEQGRFDEAQARWEAFERAGGADEARRVRFALALLEAGDLEGADALRERFQGSRIDAALAGRWNAALAREQAALQDYGDGVKALVAGDPSAPGRLDRAFAYFRNVKRPHLPQDRADLHAHLMMGALSEPLRAGDVEGAARWLDGISGAPAAEVAAVRAAYASARGDRAAAREALARLEGADLPPEFQLLVLEARARVAEGDAERAAVRSAAQAFPRERLADDDRRRVEAVIAAPR